MRACAVDAVAGAPLRGLQSKEAPRALGAREARRRVIAAAFFFFAVVGPFSVYFLVFYVRVIFCKKSPFFAVGIF